MRAEGLILAGGKSTRMGGIHKGSLTYKDAAFMQILIREFQREGLRVRISYGTERGKDWGGCPVIMDIYPGCGPIGGLHAGLRACGSKWLAVAACDMPFLKIELFRYLMDRLLQEEREKRQYTGAVPVTDGRVHPLAAIYHTGAAGLLEEAIRQGNYRLRDVLGHLDMLYVDLTEQDVFREMLQNINTREEYERLVENE